MKNVYCYDLKYPYKLIAPEDLKIAVVGGGWFGCHIASLLKDKGCKVVLFEKNDRLFGEASQHNTGRLHMGLHYPRSLETRTQSLTGFRQFMEKYPSFCEESGPNLYAIVHDTSFLDFGTYLQVLQASSIPYTIETSPEWLSGIEGLVSCPEMAINPHKARNHFSSILKEEIRFNSDVHDLKPYGQKVKVRDELFDFAINCTYFQLFPAILPQPVVHEVVVTLLLDRKKTNAPEALVVMDGNFFSINPYFLSESDKCHSLYHVSHSVVFKSNNRQEAVKQFEHSQKQPIEKQINHTDLLKDVRAIFPEFTDYYSITGSFVSLRTKLDNQHAGRPSLVKCEGRTIHVLAGKISSVFSAGEFCMNHIFTS